MKLHEKLNWLRIGNQISKTGSFHQNQKSKQTQKLHSKKNQHKNKFYSILKILRFFCIKQFSKLKKKKKTKNHIFLHIGIGGIISTRIQNDKNLKFRF